MNELDQHSKSADEHSEQPSAPVDSTRRRLAGGGALGAGVLLSVASRSAFGTGTWGTCTGSEIASGNMSREGTPRPCGCSPGFWRNSNGSQVWGNSDLIPYIYAPGQVFNSVFGVNFFSNSASLKNAIDKDATATVGNWCRSSKKDNMKTCAFHAVAALLNAQYYGNRYPVIGLQTPGAVISAFQSAFSGGVDSLIIFKNRVDVYQSGVWCEGQDH